MPSNACAPPTSTRISGAASASASQAEGPATYANGRLSLEVALEPGASWHACLLYTLIDGDDTYPAPGACIAHCTDSDAGARLTEWRRDALKLRSSNEEIYRLYHQAVDDIAALRMPLASGGYTHVAVAAGLPWFVALFGRDSLIVSLQTALVTPTSPAARWSCSAATQARERDDYRDAEPGKILHELRCGELAHFKLIPHTPYYGTADATPL